jgi:hypothetical protein
MAHNIVDGPHTDIKIFELYEDLTFADMTADKELDLDKGYPVYVLLDGSQMQVGLPADFLSGAKQSWFTNPNLAHLAVYLESAMLRTIAQMVAKITKRRDKLTLHDSRAAALAHLEQLRQAVTT